tara:strand:+ start:1086 stop:1844 length:759 start_codon:yes stop_codon:yes gene_type:complete
MILAILQARTSSTRLPGKVLKPILGIPMLTHQIRRIKKSEQIDQLIIATSDKAEDDQICPIGEATGTPVFRGSLDDVLDRFYQATRRWPAEHIVRLTGDCPVIDPVIIDRVISRHLATQADYTSNCRPATFPDGMDVEVITQQLLERFWNTATEPADREHVTLMIEKEREQYQVESVLHDPDLSNHRWTVDNNDDFQLVSEIYKHLYDSDPDFSMRDILFLLESEPELMRLNNHHLRNESLPATNFTMERNK